MKQYYKLSAMIFVLISSIMSSNSMAGTKTVKNTLAFEKVTIKFWNTKNKTWEKTIAAGKEVKIKYVGKLDSVKISAPGGAASNTYLAEYGDEINPHNRFNIYVKATPWEKHKTKLFIKFK